MDNKAQIIEVLSHAHTAIDQHTQRAIAFKKDGDDARSVHEMIEAIREANNAIIVCLTLLDGKSYGAPQTEGR